MDMGSILQYIMNLISQGGSGSGSASVSDPQMTSVNDINTYISFFIYQVKFLPDIYLNIPIKGTASCRMAAVMDCFDRCWMDYTS